MKNFFDMNSLHIRTEHCSNNYDEQNWINFAARWKKIARKFFFGAFNIFLGKIKKVD